MEKIPWEKQKVPVPPGPSGSCRSGSHRFMSDRLELPRVGSGTIPVLLCGTSGASIVLVTAAWFRGLLYDSLRRAKRNKRGRRGTRIVFPGAAEQERQGQLPQPAWPEPALEPASHNRVPMGGCSETKSGVPAF